MARRVGDPVKTQPRWPAGAPKSQEGEFAPKKRGSGAKVLRAGEEIVESSKSAGLSAFADKGKHTNPKKAQELVVGVLERAGMTEWLKKNKLGELNISTSTRLRNWRATGMFIPPREWDELSMIEVDLDTPDADFSLGSSQASSSSMVERGSNAFERAKLTLIHELSHYLHFQAVGYATWLPDRIPPGPKPTAAQTNIEVLIKKAYDSAYKKNNAISEYAYSQHPEYFAESHTRMFITRKS
jgi:hypothetical protein